MQEFFSFFVKKMYSSRYSLSNLYHYESLVSDFCRKFRKKVACILSKSVLKKTKGKTNAKIYPRKNRKLS